MDPTGDPRIAFTFSNGFFRQGQLQPGLNLPLDRIYLGRRSFFALTDSEFCAFIMLHEMAHFVGFPGGAEIPDNGRGWFTDSTITRLSADQRQHNADSTPTPPSPPNAAPAAARSPITYRPVRRRGDPEAESVLALNLRAHSVAADAGTAVLLPLRHRRRRRPRAAAPRG
jgi:hypothetical protein